MIEARVNDAWCPLASTKQVTSGVAPTDDYLIGGVMCLSHCDVEHPELGVVAIHPRTFAWRRAADG